jgi:hypothetical protein
LGKRSAIATAINSINIKTNAPAVMKTKKNAADRASPSPPVDVKADRKISNKFMAIIAKVIPINHFKTLTAELTAGS